ncbi:MAG TPA: hypothetical protein V6C81_15490 [Planktothrix sp.]|jgi:hypothetical protein
MDQGFVTTWPLFLAILAGYIGISLVIGGKKAYFEPFDDEEKPPESKPPEEHQVKA